MAFAGMCVRHGRLGAGWEPSCMRALVITGPGSARVEDVEVGVAGVPSPIDSRGLVLGDMTAVGILGASAGLAPAIEHYADGRVGC
jgi:hypothetical protein